jgi:NitT/TauT family transport system permease protein
MPETTKPSTGKDITPGSEAETSSLEAGLDALDRKVVVRTPWLRKIRKALLPPIVAATLLILIWQILFWMEIKPPYVLPSPLMVWDEFADQWADGNAQEAIWTSVSRGLTGFAMAIVIAVPIGLVVARFRPVRTAIGPLLTGLQTLPSVAWVPAAIIWFGLTNATIYAVILLGAVPSIANGLVAGIDQTPPLYNRVGRVLGAKNLSMVRHVMMPAAFPGFLAGLKQGWAFSWRSLMAAEIITRAPALGLGLGQLLEDGRQLNDMSIVLVAILLILFVGVAVELLLFTPLERRMLKSRGLAGAQ